MEEKIIDKIRKLLKNQESSKKLGNLHEAEQFAKVIKKLLTKYNLELSQIGPDSDEQTEVEENSEKDFTVNINKGKWEVNLLTIIARNNFCTTIYTPVYGNRYNRNGLPLKVAYRPSLIGKPENIEIVKFLYEILVNQLDILSKESFSKYQKDAYSALENYSLVQKKQIFKSSYTNRGKYIKSFLLGATRGVDEKLKEEYQESVKEYGKKITDLVIVRNAEIDKFVELKYPGIKSMRSRRKTVDSTAYSRGKQAGKNAQIAKGVNSGKTVGTISLN